MQQNVKTSLGVAIIIILVATIVVFTWKAIEVKNSKPSAPIVNEPVQNNPAQDQPITNQPTQVCTQEAKQCPDGSYVSRTETNCEFASCPESKDESVIYKNTDYGFQMALPKEWAKYQVSIQRDKGDNKHTYFYFMMPSTDKSWNGSYDKNTGGIIKGMADIFVITANDLTTWNKDLNSKECKENPNPDCPYEGSVLAKNGKYVFDASYGNGLLPPDVQKFRVGNSAVEFLSGKFSFLK